MERTNCLNGFLMLIFLIGSLNGGRCQVNEMETNKNIVAGQFEKWQNGQASFFDLLADDVEWEVTGTSPVSGKYLGKRDFVQNAVTPISDRLHTPLVPDLISLSVDDGNVWLVFNASATAKNGRIYENTYAWKLQMRQGMIVKGIAFLDTYALSLLMNDQEPKRMDTIMKTIEETKDYIGMWVTKDGYIRHELLHNNRYDEARGKRKSAYQGKYIIKGNHIDYKDDTGFTADGEFKDGILYHGGMIFYKER